MAYRVRDFTGESAAGFQSIANAAGTILDKRKADLLAKEGGLRIKQLQDEEAERAKTNKLLEDTERRGVLAPAATEGVKTPTGTAVDFQQVKEANKWDSEASLHNIAFKGTKGFVPMNGRAMQRMADADAATANKADQETIRTEERATETHVSKMANDKAAREAGRYSPVVLGDGRLAGMNTRDGSLKDTGEKGQPKAGAKNAEFNALPMEAQEQVKVLSKNMGFQKTLRSSVASDLEQFKAAKTPDAALSYGLGMLKALNSTLGPDALSNDESERLGAELKTQIGNWRGPGKFIGKDLGAFVDKVQAKVNSLEGSIKRSEGDIDALYGRKPADAAASTSSGPVKIKDDADFEKLASGTVFIGPDGKTRTKP